MVDTVTLVYVIGVTVLFFFWIYGIYAFLRDLRRTYIPKARQVVRGWKRLRDQEDGPELDEHERQLL